MIAVVLTITLVAMALAQAAHAQDGDAVAIPGLLEEIVALMDQANETNTILYLSSFCVGAGLAGIAIYATYRNASRLNRQLKIYENRTRLLREDIDVDRLPILTWTLAGRRFGEPGFTGLGAELVIVRIVNAGRSPALRATAGVTHRLSRGGGGLEAFRREHHSWGAILADDFVEMPVWIQDETVEAVKSGRAAFRADVELECRSVTGRRHKRRMTVTHDGRDVILRDVAEDEWRRDIGLDGGEG